MALYLFGNALILSCKDVMTAESLLLSFAIYTFFRGNWTELNYYNIFLKHNFYLTP